MAHHLDGRPLGKWQKQLKKSNTKMAVGRSVGEMVLILDLVLFLKGSTGSENTRLYSRGQEKSIYVAF